MTDISDHPLMNAIDAFASAHNFVRDAAEFPVAVAVSGGPDSMALCYVLSRWALQNSVQIHAITVDHGLRAESSTEARRVGEWLADLPNVRHAVLTRTIDKEHTKSRIMEDARNDRYAMMADYCASHNIRYLFVAHHRDDQAETFLFRLAKGSGLDGLSCMAASQDYGDDLVLVRPFLALSKEDIHDYCTAEDVPFIRDPSNEKDEFARPRLRASRAVLEGEGLTSKRLSVTAGRMARARAALEYYTDMAFSEALQERDADYLCFDFSMLSAQPTETRLRVLLAVISGFWPDRSYAPRMEKAEDLERRIFEGAEPFKGATLGGVVFAMEKGGEALSVRREKTP